MIKPQQQGEQLLNDIAMSFFPLGVHLWWLGQSGFLLKHQSQYILLDPYLSDSLTRKYEGSEHPHVRMTELAIDPSMLPPMDVVTSSHNHTDHLDAETLEPIIRNSPGLRFVIPEANREFVAQRLRCDPAWPIGLVDGESVSFDGIKMNGVLAAHNEIERDSLGRPRFMGYVIELGGVGIYHSGDTRHFHGIEDSLRQFHVDVALLPINGHRPERGVAGNLFGDEAARLGKAMGARLVIPCHYEMFDFNTETPELFIKTCEQIGQSFHVMQCGERIHITPQLA
jgi:L-ascorbate metabolism protein UlaG (beta-lactamase superfamily)